MLTRPSLFLIFFLNTLSVWSQIKPPTATTNSTQGTPINFTADIADFRKENGQTVGHLRSNGNPCRFFQGNAIMTSDSAILFQDENRLNAFGHVVIHQADTVTITGDRLYYDGKTRLAKLYDNIVMTDRQGVLTTNHLDYDLNTKVGTYYDGGRITNKDNILLSRTGYYYENTKVAYFKTKVTILTPQTTITSDTLQYNTLTRIAYFFGPTRIVGKDDFIYCENGEYNTATDHAKFSQHAYYLSGSKRLSGDSLYYDRKTGFGRAVRHVVFHDSVEKAFLYGGIVQYDKPTEITFATINPLFVLLTTTSDTLNTYPDSLEKAKIIERGKVREEKVQKKLGKNPLKEAKTRSNAVSPPDLPPIQGRIILDTLITVPLKQSDLSQKNRSKIKTEVKHLIRSVVEKVDSLFLTADSLKTALVTGDRARPQFGPKRINRIRKTRFDSLDKRAIKLLGDIRQDVIQDSLKKLPGYKAPAGLKATFNKIIEKTAKDGQPILPDSLSSKIKPLAQDSLIKKKKSKSNQNIKRSIPTTSLDSIDKDQKYIPKNLPPPHRGFFARLFGGRKQEMNSLKEKQDSLLKKKIDSLSKIKKIPLPYLLEGVPVRSEEEWINLFNHGKRPIRYEDTAHYRIIFAYHHARLFKSDFQSAADSMVYTYFDSTVRCYKSPILWTEGSQMTGDTISLRMKNQKLDSLAMIRSAFIISKVDSMNLDRFNQISGRNMFGRFRNNNLVRLLVEGNGKSLYYAQEDKKDSLTKKTNSKIIGLNSTIASYFIITFKNNKPVRINSVDKPESHFYPLKKVSPGKERLSGFLWRDSERPKSRIDIFRKPTVAERLSDTLINKKTAIADSLDDSNPNILDLPKPVIKKGKPKGTSGKPSSPAIPPGNAIKPVTGVWVPEVPEFGIPYKINKPANWLPARTSS